MVKLKLRPTTPILSHATLAHALGINSYHSLIDDDDDDEKDSVYLNVL